MARHRVRGPHGDWYLDQRGGGAVHALPRRLGRRTRGSSGIARRPGGHLADRRCSAGCRRCRVHRHPPVAAAVGARAVDSRGLRRPGCRSGATGGVRRRHPRDGPAVALAGPGASLGGRLVGGTQERPRKRDRARVDAGAVDRRRSLRRGDAAPLRRACPAHAGGSASHDSRPVHRPGARCAALRLAASTCDRPWVPGGARGSDRGPLARSGSPRTARAPGRWAGRGAQEPRRDGRDRQLLVGVADRLCDEHDARSGERHTARPGHRTPCRGAPRSMGPGPRRRSPHRHRSARRPGVLARGGNPARARCPVHPGRLWDCQGRPRIRVGRAVCRLSPHGAALSAARDAGATPRGAPPADPPAWPAVPESSWPATRRGAGTPRRTRSSRGRTGSRRTADCGPAACP